MYAFTTASISSLLLALFALQIAAFAIEKPSANGIHLAARQAQISCDEYATLANLSTIGANNTFRGPFIQASPDGTKKSSGILDAAVKKFTELKLINDTQLNNECGNLTDIALKEAPKNLTKGLVGPFTISGGVKLGSGVGSVVFMATLVGTAVMYL